jgi:superfamily II DNA or RNA helicase
LAPRNAAILSAVKKSTERSILLFANNVSHAVELAARLSIAGITSRVVSGETDRSARQDAVAAFKRGEVRVICNAVVFATGFDAPGVEMVLIAKPVFSPVSFMQMVGRGLRGPMNGGTERCRILTVQDNIEGYAESDPLKWWRKYYE